MRQLHRTGTVLIIVSGVAAVLAAMTLAFLMRMRSDLEESQLFTRDMQARVMMTSALQYIQETSRLGWDNPNTAEKEETYGWIDVRDGLPGPKDQKGNAATDKNGNPAFVLATGLGSSFPAIAGTAARCPLYVMRRPPCAISQNEAPNPMVPNPLLPWSSILHNNNLDPKPVVAISYDDFVLGDSTPRYQSEGWFRVYRKSIATFVVTCGAGASQGFRHWNEVSTNGHESLFGTQETFEELRRFETMMWFEAEWNPAVGGNVAYQYQTEALTGSNLDAMFKLTELSSPNIGKQKPNSRQFYGTFLYIQRLPSPPAEW
jgi:hypothetical protein